MSAGDRAISQQGRVNNRTIPVADWWLNLVGDLIRRDHKGRDYTQIGIDLAKLVGRPAPFDKSAISNAINHGKITEDLIAALCIEHPTLPWPCVIANTQAEAVVIREALIQHWRRDLDQDDEPEAGDQPAIVTFPRRVTREQLHGTAATPKKRRKAH